MNMIQPQPAGIPERRVFDEELNLFREQVRRFLAAEVVPHIDAWWENGKMPQEAFRRLGEQGLLSPTVPEAYGGVGANFLYNAVITEEFAYTGASATGISVHNDIVTDYLVHYGPEPLKQRLLPKMVSGEAVGAIAMTEPGTGSDLQSIRTTAIAKDDGFVVNGQKTFISNGQNADIIIVAAKTDPKGGSRGTSLLVVESDMPGFRRGRNLKKMGIKDQDTSELFFDDVFVPAGNLLGELGRGFAYMMQELPQERLAIGTSAMGAAQKAYDLTVEYVRERQAFGQSIMDFQNTRFVLAEVKTDLTVGWAYLDQCLQAHKEGRLSVTDAAIAKLWHSEMQCRVIDKCLQLFGGYGYMDEYLISRLYTAARVQRIYAGTNEIMKELIARSI